MAGPCEGGLKGHEQRIQKPEGFFRVPKLKLNPRHEPKSSWKQAVSLQRHTGLAYGEASNPIEEIIQEDKELKDI